MGQRVSSCTHPSFACSNYGDYEKLKSEEDSIVQKKNKSQEDSYYIKCRDSYPELHFPFELKKRIKQSFPLTNPTDDYMAFRVMGTNPKKYSVSSNIGAVSPRSTYNIKVTMQAQEEAPPNMQCKDIFVFKTIFVKPGATRKYITPEMFEKNSDYEVKELIMRVVYVAPPNPASPVQESAIKNRLLEHLSSEKRLFEERDQRAEIEAYLKNVI